MNRRILIIITTALIWSSCNNNSQKDKKTAVIEFDGKVNNQGDLSTDSGEFKIFTLPTPLQIPTILKLNNYSFNESFLAPLNDKYLSFNKFERAINTGIYGINLGYCTIYEQPTQAINYFSRVKLLMNNDDYKVIINDDKSASFERNINNIDSLSKMILEAYYELHQQFQIKEEEGYGLLILSGAFIEGLYMTTHNNEIPNVERHFNIIGQQKIFLENILSLLTYYSNSKDVAALIHQLKELQTVFNEFDIEFNEKNGVISNNLSVDTYEKIANQIEVIRNNILTN